ncbi:glycosyltransferase family 2 protein [Pseudohongiella sp.]|uniref:Glycosyltransferase 2-like domain-containing protein n=1 Tax=marine sediment metagenome TaxID=412755 RepID=A0A0F9W5F7_9ZZZZ|nr:glycosyltransferase family 2 protein [Pseudohongiella sp.]HDZ09224.1 glycosyltransferase [Pseudohongiella sp.]HEA63348.1 glycosyltransferase [Pseudohongiella sp.]
MLEQITTLFLRALNGSAEWVVGFVIAVGLAQNLVVLIQLLIASGSMRREDQTQNRETLWQQRAPGAPPISLIAPAYNESMNIVESTRSLLSIRYPHFEVIVVNDGSKDDTLQKLIDNFDLRPSLRAYDNLAPHQPIRRVYQSGRYNNLVVVDKENGGKADALNVGINVSRSPLFCAVDADSMLESDALLHAVQPFLSNPTEVIAVGGTIRVANGCDIRGGRVTRVGLSNKLIPLLQTVEYTRAFLVARVAMSELKVLIMISGAFGIFRRSSTLAAGGYDVNTVGEDYELVLRLHRYHRENRIPYEVVSVAEPVCWTEVPENLTILSRQRRRWQRGALETFFKHRKLLMNPRYGRIGVIGMPFSLLIDVIAPLVEVLGYVLVPLLWFSGMLNPAFALAFLALTFFFGIFVSAGALILEEVALHRIPRAKDLLKLIAIVLIENFGYRQLNNIWRAQGWWEFIRKKKNWGEMTRSGLGQSAKPVKPGPTGKPPAS